MRNAVLVQWLHLHLRESEDQRGAWLAPCHPEPLQGLRLPAASPSHLTAPCSCACCSLLLDCPLLSPAPNLHVTFTLQQDVTSLQRLPRGPPETTLVAEHGLLCILSSDFCSLLSPHRTCRDLEREFKALHKRKAFATEDG